MVGTVFLINNLWVIIAALLVFIMTIAVGFLEIGELGDTFSKSLMKTILITGTALFVMAFVGFNIAFAPTIGGVIGNPLYGGLFLGGFSTAIMNVWWSMSAGFFNTGLTTATYFLFETAFASVTLALVSVIVLRKMKLGAFMLFSVIYFLVIWTLPAAWIWNPTGWLYGLGMRDFAGGLVVHAAAAAAGLGILYRIWQEEKARGYKRSPKVAVKLNKGWLTLAILLLWMGWFGFNPGSVLAFNEGAMTVVITTFLAAAAAMASTILFRYVDTRRKPNIIYDINGILMGLIVITPLAGFVSPLSAVILGFFAGPIFIYGGKLISRARWFTDPVGLLPGHMLGGIFGVLMIAFFTQASFAAAAGTTGLPNGLLFGGGIAAASQLGIEAFGIVVVMAFAFAVSYVTCLGIAKLMNGITTERRERSRKAGRHNS